MLLAHSSRVVVQGAAEQVVTEVVLIKCRFFMDVDAEKVKKENVFSN